MNRRFSFVCLLIVFIVALSIYFVYLQKNQNDLNLTQTRDYNYILLTVDTLRADRISCYGFPDIATPNIDLFAEHGVKFERCYADTPLTLPSHTSILSGTLPLYHGVRDNGGFLVPQDINTLAELFSERNFQTAAFVSSFVLDSKWNLNQGFNYYFDQFDLSRYDQISLADVQRRGDEVMDEALRWLREHKENKFFSWIHIYDPHAPYEPPSPFKEKYPGRPYLGEIAFADHQLGRLWAFLQDNNLIQNTILIFASDHGESLGEHDESTHGFFIYQESLHVPLIFVLPFKTFQGITRPQVVALIDIMPTVLELAGIPSPPQIQGKSLVPIFSKGKLDEDRLVYSETYYPRHHYGWSELKCVQNSRYKLILAPRNELYDLFENPDESINLSTLDSGEVTRLRNLAQKFIKEFSQGGFRQDYMHIDEETREKLASLGYIGTFSETKLSDKEIFRDPKDKIAIFNMLGAAKELALRGMTSEAVLLIESIIRDDPEVIDAYFTIGNIYFAEQAYDKALQYFMKVLKLKPDHAFSLINIVNCNLSLGKIVEAEKIIEDSLGLLVPDSLIYYYLGSIKRIKGEYDQAILNLSKCIDLNPFSASGYSELGAVYVIQNNFHEAEKLFQKAILINTRLANLHYNYAELFEKRGDSQSAYKEYSMELEYNPDNYKASYNLAVLYRNLGDEENEKRYLEKTIEINNNFPLSYIFLSRIYLHEGRNYQLAIELAEKGLSLGLDKQHKTMAYFLLAAIYSRMGKEVSSQEYLKKAKTIQD